MARRVFAVLAGVLGLFWAAAPGCAGGERPRVSAPSRPKLTPPPDAAVASTPPVAASAAPFPRLTLEQACALPVTGDPMPALPQATPFFALEGTCTEPFCVSMQRAPNGADACYIADDNLRRAEQLARGSSAAPAPRGDPWNGTARPQYLDRIDAHLHLSPEEHALLRKNGFVVLDRLAYVSYAAAFHDIFQEQLPLYVGIDPIFHAVFRNTELVLETLERERLEPALERLLKKLRKTLANARGRYDEATRRDLDVYLGVAAALFQEPALDTPAPSLFGNEDEVRALVSKSQRRELEEVELFGRSRMIDFSQLEPRGHYAAAGYPWPKAGPYFQTLMWLSRLEFNLVSRSSRSSQPGARPDPAETPREARDALALAELVERSGALTELLQFESAYAAFAGRREDVSIPELLRLMRGGRFSARDAGAPERLKAAIGDGHRRTARIHYMPEGAGELPAIATLFGPRITPDIAPLTRLVHDRIEERKWLGAADLAHTLGHDRAAGALAEDLQNFPKLRAELATARAELRREADQSRDVHGSWLRAILALPGVPDGRTPSFLRSAAHADARLNSSLAAYAQLRHTFVLMAAQGYDAYGCEIPDAYVEPLLPAYDALVAHVAAVRKVAGGGFDGLDRNLRLLQEIAATELKSGLPSEAQRKWLAMVAEHVPQGGYGGDSGEPPKWTGWYFDLFENRQRGATRTSALVADDFTLTNAGAVAYVGTEGPRLAVFVVDAAGQPKAMVGPVAKAYELHAPIAWRLDDAAARENTGHRAFWRASYAAPARPEPELGFAGEIFYCPRGGAVEARVVIQSARAVGPVSVTLLDHHAEPLTPALSLDVRPGTTTYRFALTPAFSGVRDPVEALALEVGSFTFSTSPSAYCCEEDADAKGMPVRPRGTSFELGAKLAERRRVAPEY